MLKKIVLHSSAVDSAGNFHDAGAELDVISEGAKAGAIVSTAAQDLINQNRALSMTQAVATKTKAATKAKPKAKRTAKKPAATPATPVAEPAPPPVDDGPGIEPAAD